MDAILQVEFSRLSVAETPVKKTIDKVNVKYDFPTFATPRPVSKCKLPKGSGIPQALDFEKGTIALVKRHSQTFATVRGGEHQVKKVAKDRNGPKKPKASAAVLKLMYEQQRTPKKATPEATRTFSPMDLD